MHQCKFLKYLQQYQLFKNCPAVYLVILLRCSVLLLGPPMRHRMPRVAVRGISQRRAQTRAAHEKLLLQGLVHFSGQPPLLSGRPDSRALPGHFPGRHCREGPAGRAQHGTAPGQLEHRRSGGEGLSVPSRRSRGNVIPERWPLSGAIATRATT